MIFLLKEYNVENCLIAGIRYIGRLAFLYNSAVELQVHESATTH